MIAPVRVASMCSKLLFLADHAQQTLAVAESAAALVSVHHMPCAWNSNQGNQASRKALSADNDIPRENEAADAMQIMSAAEVATGRQQRREAEQEAMAENCDEKAIGHATGQPIHRVPHPCGYISDDDCEDSCEDAQPALPSRSAGADDPCDSIMDILTKMDPTSSKHLVLQPDEIKS